MATFGYRLALDKDPEYVRALIVMGQTLLQNGQPAEATEYLERAISKVLIHIGFISIFFVCYAPFIFVVCLSLVTLASYLQFVMIIVEIWPRHIETTYNLLSGLILLIVG